MTDETSQFDKTGSGKVSDETVRRFLLGRLTPGEQVVFEERLFREESLEEKVRLAELELADDYAFGRLSAADQELFERVFPVSVARRQQLSVSRALRAAQLLSAAPQTAAQNATKTRMAEVLRRLFGFDRPALGYAVAFAVLLLFAGVVWVVVKQRRSHPPVIATYKPTPTATREFAHPPGGQTPPSNGSPQPTDKTSPTPDNSSSLPLLATFVLSPDALREGGDMTRIAVPQSGQGLVRLQLKPETDGSGPYAVELMTAEGLSVFVGRRLKESSHRVAFDVPGRLLKTGDYQVRLRRRAGGSTAEVGRYYFRVTQ